MFVRFLVALLLVGVWGPGAAAQNPPPGSPKPKPKKATVEEAKTATQKWLSENERKGLVLNVKEEKTLLQGRAIAGSRSTMFVFQKPGWYLTLGFDGKLTPDMTAAQVQQKLKYVVLDRLPIAEIKAPGWEIRPQTPVSSFKEGVKITSFEDGRIQFKVETRFFAIYGRDPSVLVPADAPTPPHAYFQIRKNFPLNLTMDAPLKLTAP